MIKSKLVLTLVIGFIAITVLNGCTNNEKKTEEINKVTENINSKEEVVVDTYDPILMLVNDQYWVEEEFAPIDLEKVNIPFTGAASADEMNMKHEAAKALENLFDSALMDGIELYGVSGYRSYELQQYIYDTNVYNNGQDYTNKYVAIPGRSEHQIGLAMDLGDSTGNLIENGPESQWIANNAHTYGFILRYPSGKENITGYNYEPWHIRYVGEIVAKEIYNNNLTLEEYFK